MNDATGDEDELYANSEGDTNSINQDLHDEVMSPVDGYFGANPGRGDMPQDSPIDRSGLAPSPASRGNDRMSANIPHVPNVMVEDPTLRQDAAESKAREAAAEASGMNVDQASGAPEPLNNLQASSLEQAEHANSSSEAAPHSPPHSPEPGPASQFADRHQQRRVQIAPIPVSAEHHVYFDAPPAYTPAREDTSYGTIRRDAPPHLPQGQHHEAEEQQPLLGDAAHRTMSPAPETDVFNPIWRVSGWSKRRTRPKAKTFCVLILILTIIIAVALLLGYALSQRPVRQEFFEEPVNPAKSHEDEELQWALPDRCGAEVRERSSTGHSWTFHPDATMSLFQWYDGSLQDKSVHLSGDLILRPATDKYQAGYVLVESISNTENFRLSVTFDSQASGISVVAQRGDRNPAGVEPCLQVRVVLYVPLHARVRTLDVQTQQLNIVIEEGLCLGVTEVANMVAVEGDLVSPERHPDQLSAPYQFQTIGLGVASYRGNVRGWFPLYGVLVLGGNGGIRATSTMKTLKSGTLQMAELRVESQDGNIHIQEYAVRDSKAGIARDHNVYIKTRTGHIEAETLYGSIVEAETMSGHLDLNVTPALGSDCRRWGHKLCELKTETRGGSQHILVNPSIAVPGSKIKSRMKSSISTSSESDSSLVSQHSSETGDIVAFYPSSWEGTLFAATIDGHMTYRGDGLVLEKGDPVHTKLRGHKGNGDSLLVVATDTGAQNVMIGS